MSLGRVVSRFLPVTLLTLPLVNCAGSPPESPVLTAEVPLHLEEYLDAAKIVSSEVPADLPEPMEWSFDEPQPDWKPVVYPRGPAQPVETSYAGNALRLRLTEANRGGRFIWGLIYVDLPDYRLADWGTVLIRARTSDMVGQLNVLFNLSERGDRASGLEVGASPLVENAPVIGDGSVHTYAFRVDRIARPPGTGDTWRPGSRDFGPWRQLVIGFYAEEPSSVDILSVTLVPAEAAYADAPAGVRTEILDLTYRRTLYTHAPGRLEYRVSVPEDGRLDLGLGILRADAPVTFRVTARTEGGEAETLFEEGYSDHQRWALRSVDLSHLAGRNATLSLEADAERAGTVALWAAPTISGARATEKPNVVFYVIDGGSADRMSVYGYNRRTTPNLERLAAHGALFENAYSNSTETEPSTPSFVTSLQTSVLLADEGTWRVPQEEVSMAERLHAVGYQTALFTSNPHAGWYSGLERGLDVLRDAVKISDTQLDSASSVQLHDDYWRWRESYPGEPYMVHFQTTDVHWGSGPLPPFSGLYVGPELRERYAEWERRMEEARGRTAVRIPEASVYTAAGVDPMVHVHVRGGLYDEAMAQQDYQIGQLVRRLKEEGEWENTLLIIAADHGHWAAGLRDPDFELSEYDPMFRSGVTRIPLLFVWPGRISGGQRFSQPVSMIDVLPTILDLIGLPRPEIAQGQSLAPLLLGEEGWEPRPVILDEFRGDPETGELTGVIEVIDGRWGASLLIKPRPGAWPESQRSAPLLLYDLWNDPHTRHSVHEERRELVEYYTAFLEAQFEAHQSLAQLLTPSDPLALTPEQLQALRSLGYIQ